MVVSYGFVPPAEFLGQYDIVNVRFFVAIVTKATLRQLLQNPITLLSNYTISHLSIRLETEFRRRV
jgi:hypothetical protein